MLLAMNQQYLIILKKKSKLVNMLFIDAFTSAWEDKKNGFD